MYRYSEIITNQLIIFNEAMPFDDVLKKENRWVKLAGLVDWERFEKTYGRLFSHTGRPALPARMVIGALILKHILEMSDEELTRHLAENPYMRVPRTLMNLSMELC